MHKVPIKPLSLNHAFRGRRFATAELKRYKQDICYLAPSLVIPKGKLRIRFLFGFSSKGSDVDNCVKCAMDALSEKYSFNDNLVYALSAEKVDVKKGEEFFSFEISDY